MSRNIGYATQDAASPLAPLEFERAAVGPEDVRIDIAFCGVCHSDVHQARDEFGSWAPAMTATRRSGAISSTPTSVRHCWTASGPPCSGCGTSSASTTPYCARSRPGSTSKRYTSPDANRSTDGASRTRTHVAAGCPRPVPGSTRGPGGWPQRRRDRGGRFRPRDVMAAAGRAPCVSGQLSLPGAAGELHASSSWAWSFLPVDSVRHPARLCSVAMPRGVAPVGSWVERAHERGRRRHRRVGAAGRPG